MSFVRPKDAISAYYSIAALAKATGEEELDRAADDALELYVTARIIYALESLSETFAEKETNITSEAGQVAFAWAGDLVRQADREWDARAEKLDAAISAARQRAWTEREAKAAAHLPPVG